MFRKRKSKKIHEARDASIHERTERGMIGNGQGHDDQEFTKELHTVLDDETEETQEGELLFNVARNDEARPATEDDEAADIVNTFWLPRLGNDPERALNDLGVRVKELGYQLACAGSTFREPVIKRKYFIIDTDTREPIHAFEDKDADLTLLDVCLWSELAFKKWKNS